MRTQGDHLLASRVWTKVVNSLMISEADGVDGWEAGLEWNDDRREGCGNRPAEGGKAAVAAGAAASWVGPAEVVSRLGGGSPSVRAVRRCTW